MAVNLPKNAKALTRRQHPISHTKVGEILHDLDYSLQGNYKTEEGEEHPDRDMENWCTTRRAGIAPALALQEHAPFGPRVAATRVLNWRSE
jgi:hypothetical protein